MLTTFSQALEAFRRSVIPIKDISKLLIFVGSNKALISKFVSETCHCGKYDPGTDAFVYNRDDDSLIVTYHTYVFSTSCSSRIIDEALKILSKNIHSLDVATIYVIKSQTQFLITDRLLKLLPKDWKLIEVDKKFKVLNEFCNVKFWVETKKSGLFAGLDKIEDRVKGLHLSDASVLEIDEMIDERLQKAIEVLGNEVIDSFLEQKSTKAVCEPAENKIAQKKLAEQCSSEVPDWVP